LISDTPFTSAVIGSFGAGQGSSFNIDNLSIAPSPVPEPGTLLLFGSAMAGLGITWRRRKLTRQGSLTSEPPGLKEVTNVP
jgi:hypothetical protein